MNDDSEGATTHDAGDERLWIERHEFVTGMNELRIRKDTWEVDKFGFGEWEYCDAMRVKNESALETLQESLNEWFDDE